MKGFDDKFRTVPEYILGITREIWEDRGVGPALKRYYADDVLVRAANAMIVGNSGVTAATLQTLHEFPDRQLVGEDVIWNGNENDGFLSSHRLLSVMRHTGDGPYGKASGKSVRTRIVAECWIRDNQVVEEWLVRDQGAFARCLGLTAEQLARQQAEQDLSTRGRIVYFTPADDVAGEFVPSIESGDEATAYADGWRSIWHDKHPALVRSLYHPGAAVEIPGGETRNGHSELDRFVIGYLASFPDADWKLEQLMVNKQPGNADRLAMRWSIDATHSGWGHFGKPSNAPVHIMGLTHAYLVDGRVTMEWILIDEVSVWKQIIAHQYSESSTLS